MPAPTPILERLRHQGGFTVGELIVVVAIIITLSILAVPTIRDYTTERAGLVVLSVYAAPLVGDPSPVVGQDLRADPGGWTPAGVTFSYQWQRCDKLACRPAGSERSYVVANDDRGYRLRVQVSGSYGGESLAVASEPTNIVP